MDSELMTTIENSAFLKRKFKFTWAKFQAKLRLPTYKLMKYYTFHDTLAALSKYFFEILHIRAYMQRQRYKRCGIELTKFEKMTEESKRFKNMSLDD